MTKNEVRAYVIRWLANKNGGMPARIFGGLDNERVHFDCGCSIIRPGRRAHPGAKSYNPSFRSRICAAHERALGDGTDL